LEEARRTRETELSQAHQHIQALEEARRTRETELDQAHQHLNQAQGEITNLRAELQQDQAMRRALAFRLEQLRYRIADAVNTCVKKIPGIHKFAKATLSHFIEWRRRAKARTGKAHRPRKKTSTASRRPTPSAVPPIPRVTADFAACTIIAKNYLPAARVLADSFLRHHPDAPFFVLLVDNVNGYFDPQRENFYLLEAEQLNIPEQEKLFFKYNVLELNTAVKPYFLEYLLCNHNLKKLVYLDPDILITNNLAPLSALLDDHSIVLTPHLTSPLKDGLRPGELHILQAGSYNLGFLALRNTEVTQRMLKWWQEKLYDSCLMDPERGMHVDQKWIDLVPGMFGDAYILRDPGYNVAYWNLHERHVKVQGKDISVNSQPSYFFHFSGLDPDNIKMVSKHQNRFKLGDIGDTKILFKRYRDLMLAAGWQETKGWPYSYDYFDNGVRIPDFARRLYWALGEGSAEFGNPFSTEEPRSFFDWLNESIDGEKDSDRTITRLWHEIYQQRTDLQESYPDVLGVHRRAFLDWILKSGRHEHSIDPLFVLNDKERHRVAFPDIPTAIPTSLPPGTSSFEQTRRKDLALRFGVNVTGYINSEKGVGEGVRADIRALEAAGIPYLVNNFVDIHGSENTEKVLANYSEENHYRTNLLHMNADQVPFFAQQTSAYFAGHFNIGYWTWELSSFPSEWCESFRYFDEIWVPSNFVLDAISRKSPIPVVRVPHSINPVPLVKQEWSRKRFGLRPDSFVFLFFFDFLSYMERKNPLGLVRAFKQAFGDREDVVLFIKCSHSHYAEPSFAMIKQACQGKNVRLYDAVLPRAAVNALMSTCDCYVSLHRSEGFGLTLSEAMSLGKPVIATAYSGNMDFMTPSNSFPVKYRLVEIERDYGPYKKGWLWAEPDLDHAAHLMRQLYENRTTAIAVGRRARQDVLSQLHPEIVGKKVKERLLTLRAENLGREN
jgi:glycosyltransferase involved in cell wall biosynthesis/lipopolysaccharide biosynthesis glycosyltransferase